jgi:hypothetical protein
MAVFEIGSYDGLSHVTFESSRKELHCPLSKGQVCIRLRFSLDHCSFLVRFSMLLWREIVW